MPDTLIESAAPNPFSGHTETKDSVVLPLESNSGNYSQEDYWIDDTQESAYSRIFGNADYTGGVFGHIFPPADEFKVFEGTEFEVIIPSNNESNREKVEQEIAELTVDTIRNEPFNLLFRHIDVLARFGQPHQVAVLMSEIINRTKEEAITFPEKVTPDEKKQLFFQASAILRVMACIEKCAEDPDVKLPSEIVEYMYKEGVAGQERLFKFALQFDRRNEAVGESIGVARMLSTHIKNINDGKIESTREKLLSALQWTPYDQGLFKDTFIDFVKNAPTDEGAINVVNWFIIFGGVERVRKILREAVKKDGSFEPVFKTVFDYLGFDPQNPQIDLRADIYEQIDFAEYTPNKEAQRFDEELLGNELTDGQKILDVGCGTGRLLLALNGKNNMRVDGIDMVPKHVDHIKKQNPDVDVRVGSWFELPYDDGEYDAAFCLGRSLTHNTTIPDMVIALKNIGRVIKPGGKLIVDMPNNQYGDIYESMWGTRDVCEKLKITNYLDETIIDGPDDSHYFDRYVPSALRFRLLAYLAGFYSEQIAEQSYHGVTGKENRNTYWRLAKKGSSEKIPPDTKSSIVRFIKGHGNDETAISFDTEESGLATLTDGKIQKVSMLQLSPPQVQDA